MSHSRSKYGQMPYMVPAFWLDSENHFWEKPGYSERGKQYHRAKIEKMRKETKLHKLNLIGK